jgi:hypothetical protein
MQMELKCIEVPLTKCRRGEKNTGTVIYIPTIFTRTIRAAGAWRDHELQGSRQY